MYSRVKIRATLWRFHNYLPIGMKLSAFHIPSSLSMQGKRPNRAVGRPRSFDADKALDQAVEVFRRKGYEGASLSDLTGAMGINRPSLYAAFGDKEALFRKAVDRYVART